MALRTIVIVWPTATCFGALMTSRAPVPAAVTATSGTWSGFGRSASLTAGRFGAAGWAAAGWAGAATVPLGPGATPALAPIVVSGTKPRRAMIAMAISKRLDR